MFENYPKIRPPLPDAIRKIYIGHYQSNRAGTTSASSLAQAMESWLHKQVASDSSCSQTTLELGAGTLNQLNYEAETGAYDIVEPFTELHIDSPLLNRIRTIYPDISNVPEAVRYHRITSIATLEHICNLPEVVARCGGLLADHGVFHAAIPNEGSLLWQLAWKLTTGLEFRIRYGLDYGLLMRHEHVNTADEIEVILKYFFKTIKQRVFGLSRSLSLYRYYECRHPRIENCQSYLETCQSLENK